MSIRTVFRAGANLTGAAALTVFCASAQAATDTAATGAAQPVNCATAEGDIRALKSEKQYAQTHQLENATALVPAGALLGLLNGTENKKLEMLSPDYQQHIDTRISQIKKTCGLK